MSFTLALPVALSAIQSLIRFRGRLDTILSLNQTTTGLPFLLPPRPTNDAPHVEPMIAFFKSDIGRALLALRGLEEAWAAVHPDPFASNIQRPRQELLEAYYEASDIMPESLGPDRDANRALVAKGPSREMRLAYYVVESDRLSRNPAVTRVLLAAADTLLEFGADNAGLFIKQPRSRALVESLLNEFAVARDWDDANSGPLFRTLLGATAASVLANPGLCPDRPVAKTLFAALAQVQQEMGADFAAKLVTRDGFHALMSSCLTCAADQPGLLPDKPVLKESLVAMLKTAGAHLTGILDQPAALSGVLEAGISAAAKSATPLLERKLAGEPLLAVVLKSTLENAEQAAADHKLFRTLADGQLFAALYRIALRGVAANPAALATQAKLDAHIAALVAGCAAELADTKLEQVFGAATLRSLTTRALEVIATEPGFLERRTELTAKLLRAALGSAAQAMANGFTASDLEEIADAVIRSAAQNRALIDMNDTLRPVVEVLALPLAERGLDALTSSAARKSMFFSGLEALATNPRVWQDLATRDLAQPLVTGVLRALAADKSGLLSGPALVPSFQATLEATARRGRAFIDEKTSPDDLEKVLAAALAAAEAAIGETIDGKTLPQFLRGVVLAFLSAPFDPTEPTTLDDWLKQQLPAAA